MAQSSIPTRSLPRVSIRGLIFLILLVALLFGWRSSEQRAFRERRFQEQRLRYAEEELRRARDELQDQKRGPRSFRQADLDGSNLAGMTITSVGDVFQRASFRRCILDGSSLVGGDASFQMARFDEAMLTRASLKGGISSFQESSFVGADLRGATLAGGDGSFQSASFEKAILIDATLSGNFQLVNISGASLEGTDLSAITRDNLASCYFKEPPTYDSRTKFPPGFDPVDRSWRRVD